jgi:hypothetical protein
MNATTNVKETKEYHMGKKKHDNKTQVNIHCERKTATQNRKRRGRRLEDDNGKGTAHTIQMNGCIHDQAHIPD